MERNYIPAFFLSNEINVKEKVAVMIAYNIPRPPKVD
jgi:hypothetical protein